MYPVAGAVPDEVRDGDSYQVPLARKSTGDWAGAPRRCLSSIGWPEITPSGSYMMLVYHSPQAVRNP